MKTFPLLLMLVTACSGQSLSSDRTEQNPADSIKIPGPSDYVILTYDPDWHWIFEKAEAANLSADELQQIEAIINRAVAEHNEAEKQALKAHNEKYPQQQRTETGYEISTEGHKRQYVPVITAEGEKQVWINFFCDDFGDELWKTKLFIVEDGGNCFFNLKVNLSKQTYADLVVNGEA